MSASAGLQPRHGSSAPGWPAERRCDGPGRRRAGSRLQPTRARRRQADSRPDDVSVEAQIVELLAEKVGNRWIGMVLVTHDLGVVSGLADRICVMYAGRIVETGAAAEVLGSPQHPSARELVSCSRLTTLSDGQAVASGPWTPPQPGACPGCRFASRCAFFISEQCLAQTSLAEG